MTNADKFKGIFGIYATELWAKPEKEFLKWLNEEVSETNVGDMINRQAAIGIFTQLWDCIGTIMDRDEWEDVCKTTANELPSVQPERDIPVKPTETRDRAWGIPTRQAVCPKCDYYLGNVAFLGDYKGKKITYCETCGQAIDWEGWDFNDE